MKWFVCLLLLPFSALQEPVQEKDEVTFSHTAMEKGDREEREWKGTQDMDVSIYQDGTLVQKAKQKTAYSGSSEMNCLETGKTWRARIAFGKCEEVISAQGKEWRKPAPRSGKTYEITRKEGAEKPSFRRGEKNPKRGISKEESTILSHDIRHFGIKEPLKEFLDGRTVKIGETLEFDDETATDIFGGPGDDQVQDLRLVLEKTMEIDGKKCAEFSVSLKITGNTPEGMQQTVVMKGTLVLETETLRSRSVTLEGEVEIVTPEVPKGTPEFRGTGKVSGTTTWIHTKTEQ